jgi:ADP-heptose:LPS heptosyltransferase
MKNDDAGACGGLFLHPGQPIETLAAEDPLYEHATIEGLSDRVNIQWYRHQRQDLIPVEHLTANILFSRKWLDTVGGFETSLYRQHRDETQATWRLHVEGAALFVDPSAVAWHLKGVDGGARGYPADIYIEDHRRFMAQRKTMKPGIHLSLGHAIGDGLMATPMLHVMRKMNPGRNIAVYAPWAKIVLTGNPDVDETADHPLDAQRTVRIEQSVYNWASANHWKGHLAEAYCRMLNLPPPEYVTPRFSLNGEEVLEVLPEEDFIVIAPWSNAKTFDFYQPSGNKNWPLDRWRIVIQWGHDAGLKVVQLRGSDEEPLVEGVDHDVCGRPVREALAVLAKARLLVSVDTMAHHAAAALGVPAVVLWGRSRPEHFGYLKPNVINIQGECPGKPVERQLLTGKNSEPATFTVVQDRPCIHGDQWAMDQEVCPLPGHPCMEGISAEAVVTAMESLLNHNVPG